MEWKISSVQEIRLPVSLSKRDSWWADDSENNLGLKMFKAVFELIAQNFVNLLD